MAASKQSKIASDLDQLKSTLREQNLLPKAARIEPEVVRNPAETQEGKTILQQIELEERISQKLRDVLQKLVARLYEKKDEEEPELERSMDELRDLILDDSRWQDADQETRTNLVQNRDTVKPLSPQDQVQTWVAMYTHTCLC